MQKLSKARWEKGIENQKGHFYGLGIYAYAERWADLMEARMKGGKLLRDVAEQASHDADTDGITGFMFGAAVTVLSENWVRGEELRQWHNASFGPQGERANELGGVINPAILTISEKD